MRVRVRHEVIHRLEPGTRTAIVRLLMTPRDHDGQYIQRWSLDVQTDCRLYPHEDSFGNLTHTFTLEGPAEEIVVVATGEVDTQDYTGIVRGTVERFPPSLFLRSTEQTEPTPAIRAFADTIRGEAGDVLGQLHALMGEINETFEEVPRAVDAAAGSAAGILAKKAGCSGGLTHVFTAASHHLGIPARHVCGYVVGEDGEMESREWAEAHVPKIGWIAFDCGRALCATDAYVRRAVGLDSLGVATLRGLGRNVSEAVTTGKEPDRQRGRQSQSQLQK